MSLGYNGFQPSGFQYSGFQVPFDVTAVEPVAVGGTFGGMEPLGTKYDGVIDAILEKKRKAELAVKEAESQLETVEKKKPRTPEKKREVQSNKAALLASLDQARRELQEIEERIKTLESIQQRLDAMHRRQEEEAFFMLMVA